MRVRRLWWFGVAAVAIVIATIVWWSRRDRVVHAPRVTYARKLDVEAFTRQVAERLRRAKATASAPKPAPAAPRHDKKWAVQGRGVMKNAGKDLMKPCTIGPQELCEVLAPLVDGCDGGDSQDCMAVGEYLVDNPPRGMMAVVFFQQACAIGDADGCERTYNKNLPADQPCANDPWGCTWAALEANDEARLDEACTLGVGDACSMMTMWTQDDDERTRAHLESACQLGLPMACQGLSRSLSPDCEPDELAPCFEPDAAEAKKAREIACRAGWGSCSD